MGREKEKEGPSVTTCEVLCLVFTFFFFKYRKNSLWFESQESREWDGCGLGQRTLVERDLHLQWSSISSCVLLTRLPKEPGVSAVARRRVPPVLYIWELSVEGGSNG